MEKRARIENPSVPLSSANILEALGLDYTTPAGVTINHSKALGITAFWAGVRIISQTIAGLPCESFERTATGRQRATEHNTYKLLHKRPNPYMTPFTFKEVRAAHCLTWGNSYAEIERDRAGRPIGLWPLLPDRTGVEIVEKRLLNQSLLGSMQDQADTDHAKIYYTYINGKRIWLSADRVLHVPGLGFDGVRGYNVIKIHCDSLGLTMAANEYGAQFFGNSGRPSGYISHPGDPAPGEREQLRAEWNQAHGGLTRAQRTAVLWGKMEFKPLSVPPEEAQFLLTRQMQIEEVARILNINPILLQQTSKQTSWGSGVEKFLVAYAKFTIMPWLEREEDVLSYDLFTEEEREKYYCKYNINELLRGDAETQAKVLEIKRRNGVINADQWRELDDENPLPDGQGKVYFVPLNWVPLDQISLKSEPAGEPGKPPLINNSVAKQSREQRSLVARKRLRDAHLAAFEDGARRYVKRDTEALIKTVKKAFEPGGSEPIALLNRWIEEFYPVQQQYIKRTMLPLVTALATVMAAEAAEEVAAEPEDMAAFTDAYTENMARREAGSSRGQVLALIQGTKEEDLQEALLTRSAEWNENRPGKVAADEVVRVASGAARFMWGTVGMGAVWAANANACPLCMEMSGKRVGPKEYFLVPGESVTPSERPGGLVAGGRIGGPPLHQSCQCSLQAGI